MKRLIILMIFIISTSIYANGAVILLYHNVSNQTPKSTSVSINTFKKHLDYLYKNNFTVLPLETILNSLKNGKQLPQKSIAITFDDAYKSILTNAYVLLKEKNYPFTIFVNTKSIQKSYKNFLSWENLKFLKEQGITIANHTHTHLHLVRQKNTETKKQWKQRITKDILTSKKILEEKLNISNNLFAYPYGEYNDDVKEVIKSLGYLGIAQQSGAISVGYNPLEIPRFPMATKYSDINRFRITVNSKALPVKNVNIGSKVLFLNDTIKQQFSFDLKKGNYIKEQIACYSSSGKKLDIEINQSTVKMSLPLWSEGRNKINCTAPSKTQKGVYYWYSQLWMVKKDNKWYKD